MVFGKAQSAGNGMPFPRTATQSKNHWAAALRERLCVTVFPEWTTKGVHI